MFRDSLDLIAGLVTIAVLFSILFGSYKVNEYSCHARYSAFQTDFGVFTGCRINIDGKLIPSEQAMIGNIAINGVTVKKDNKDD
jgi:hypothetical protein